MGKARGIALIVLLVLLSAILVGVLLAIAHSNALETQRPQRTALALAKAKEALIAYAVAVQPDTVAKRPGDLPCPDLDNDGHAELTCATAARRLGRLPWRTLGLPDLRDADGERLWYALSTRFQRTTVNQCPTPGGALCLNSETPGTLSVRDAAGQLIHDGATTASDAAVTPTGAIAVIFAPGPVLRRLGANAVQDRSCAGDSNVANCVQSGVCSSTNTALCNAANYLDRVDRTVIPALPGAEDNADFQDRSSVNGFVSGPVVDARGEVVLNDTLLVVRYGDLMPLLERRIAGEALACLRSYANGNTGHYPWAAPISADYTADLADAKGATFGRLAKTLAASGTAGLSPAWAAGCPVAQSANGDQWWANWTNVVFFAVASGYAPDSPATGCGNCLTVNPPSTSANRQVVVLVAGRPILGQVRGIGANEASYLEDANQSGALSGLFKQAARTATFNDTVVYQ